MILEKKGYSYGDLTIVPSTVTNITSRKQCNPFIKGDKLPIFTAPMSTITNEHNACIWKNNGITPILPRNLSYSYRFNKMQEGEWVALSLSEFKEYFCYRPIDIEELQSEKPKKGNTYRICVDLANGHMKSLYEAINSAKANSRMYGYTLIIMTGNIANPQTYQWICRNAEVDYIRVSIGSGANCITSTQTSIHYPIASLIDECYQFKKHILDWCVNNDGTFVDGYKSTPCIVADGGIRGYADVIKALGLGADYVMIGSLFTALLESAAPLDIECYNSHYKYSFKEDGTINNGIVDILNIWDPQSPDGEDIRRQFIKDMKSITKESYGMSTKKAQMLINPNAKTKTSEGCTKYLQVKETVHQWSDNMISYLKSAMSYTNNKTLDEFRGQVDFIINSSCSILAVNK